MPAVCTQMLQQADLGPPSRPVRGAPFPGLRRRPLLSREGRHLSRALRGFSKTLSRKIIRKGRLSFCALFAFLCVLFYFVFTANNFVLKRNVELKWGVIPGVPHRLSPAGRVWPASSPLGGLVATSCPGARDSPACGLCVVSTVRGTAGRHGARHSH